MINIVHMNLFTKCIYDCFMIFFPSYSSAKLQPSRGWSPLSSPSGFLSNPQIIILIGSLIFLKVQDLRCFFPYLPGPIC